MLAPGSYYLVQEGAGANTSAPALPTPNATGTIAMSGTRRQGRAGVEHLRARLRRCCARATAPVRDLVGYGTTATGGEGTPTPNLSNTTAALRGSGPDTDVNSADFTVGAPTPRTGTVTQPPPVTYPEPCTVTAPTAIPAVQGAGATSPLVGTTVTTRGVVVAATPGLSGFFLQDPTGDGDPATSDGIFVFAAGAQVAVGDEVAVTGGVTEFNGMTELGRVSASQPVLVQVCGTLPVPAPTTYALPEPTNGDLERVEGMSVTIPTTLTVQQNFFLGRYGQLTLGSGGRRYQPTNLYPAGSDEAKALAVENAKALITLDDASSLQNPAPVPYLDAQGTRRAGDTVTGLTGVLDQGAVSSTAGVLDYRLQPTVAPAFASSGRPAAPDPVGGTLKAASFNVLNYFTDLDTGSGEFRGANTALEFQRQRAKIVAAIAGLDADVVGLTEIENNGPVAVQDLVDALNAYVGAPGRWAVVPDPANGVGTDAIKVAQIYRTDKVVRVGESRSPVEPNAFTGLGRNPVAQAYRQLDSREVTTLVINHFKSKGSCPAASAPNAAGNTDAGDGQGCWNAQRVLQAKDLAAFVETLKTVDPDVLLVGDFNAYGEEDPIRTLEAAGFVDLLQAKIGPQAYSYVFDGLSGRLDHALGTPSLAAQVTGATEWHINADEPSVIDYNTEFKPDDRYAPTPYRSSDHDPVLVGLGLSTQPQRADLHVTVTGPATAPRGTAVTYTLTVTNSGPAPARDLVAVLGTAGLKGVTATPATGSGSGRVGSTTLSGSRWTLPALGAGETATFTVTGTTGRAGQVVVALGGAASSTPDPVLRDDLGSRLTLVTR